MTIGVAILGGGFMGQTHAAAWSTLAGRARVVSVSSRSLAKAQAVARLCAAEATDDLFAPIAAPGVDVVDVCLPTPLHREAAERAFAAGKDVLLEKPIALTVADAEAVIRAAEASGRRLMVGLVLRFWPEYQELRRIVAGGELGAPRAASAVRLSPPPGWNDWMIDLSQSGGVAIDLMTHDFDTLSAILGEPHRVFARAVPAAPGEAPQQAFAVVEHEHGSSTVEGSMLQPGSFPFTSDLRVLCELGAARYGFSAAPAADGGNIGGVDHAANRLRIYPATGEPRLVEVASADPWVRQVTALADLIERRAQPTEATGPQALSALRVGIAVNRSIESGRPEEI